VALRARGILRLCLTFITLHQSAVPYASPYQHCCIELSFFSLISSLELGQGRKVKGLKGTYILLKVTLTTSIISSTSKSLEKSMKVIIYSAHKCIYRNVHDYHQTHQ